MYCKAGFKHISLDDCEHVVSQELPKKTFTLPADYYSQEALAARREENKRKYGPGRATARREIRPEVNLAEEMF